ncbi:MAG: sensor histidine kinase [Armatimonadota bacterium]
MASRDARQYRRFTRVNSGVWLIVLAAIAWGVLRHAQGTLDLTYGQLLILAMLGVISAIGRTWVGLRDPHVMYSFTVPLAVYDIVAISVAVSMTGKYASEVWVLYLMLLASEAAVMKTRVLFVMVGVAIIGYFFACQPLPSGLWVDFGYRASAMALLPWLMHQVHRSHLEYRAELAALREQVELSRERERIAREFHDGLGSTLVRVIMGLERASRQLFPASSSDKNSHPLQEQIQELRGALNETRQMIQHLHVDETIDLRQRILQMASQVAEQLGAELRFECPPSLPTLTALQTLMCLRVVQEALNNIIKHATGVRTIGIEIRQQDNQLMVRIDDDGKGFDPTRALRGLGIHSMQERVESMGGRFSLRSALGEGTRVEFTVPIGGA